MKMRLGKHIREGEEWPRGYRLAWWDTYGDTATCYPVPLNLVLAWIRKQWLGLMHYEIKDTLLESERKHVRLLVLENQRLVEKLEALTAPGTMITPEEYEAGLRKERESVFAEMLAELERKRGKGKCGAGLNTK